MAMLEEVYGPEYLTACRRDDVLGQRGVGMMGRPGEQVPVTKGTFNLANSGTVDVHLPYPGGMDQTVRVARATDSSPAVYTARSVTSDLPSYRMMNSPNGVPEPYLLRTQRPPGFRPHVPLHASPTTFDRRQPVQRLPTVEGFERDGWQWPARPRPSYPLLCDQVQIHTRYCEVCREHAARMCKSSSAVGGAGNESLWWFWAFLAIVILVIVGIELMRWFKQGFSSWPIAPSMASSLGSSRIEFECTKPLPYVNALRRSILSMIPHLAIDHVVIEVNDTNNNPSQFHHMMQMIPLAIVSNASLTFDFLLDVVCPPEESMIAVTSDSIQVLTPYEDAARLIRPNVFLFWLMKGQRVRLRAQSSRGTPHQHARYQVGNAGYRIVPTIRIPERSSSTSSTVLPDLEDQLVASCPKRVFVRLPDDMVDGSSTKVQVDAAYPTLCVNCGACAPFGVTIEPSPQTLMYVESNIVDTPSYVMRRGLEVLRDRVYELLQVSAEWIIREDGVVPNTHILETPLLNMTVAQLLVYELSLLPLVTFHATKITHPLENKTVTRLRVITDEDTRTVQRDIEVVRDTLREAFLSVAERLQEWLDESSSSM